MSEQHHWKTGMSHVEPNKILIRGYPVQQVMGKLSFAGAVYLLWTGNVPTLCSSASGTSALSSVALT